MVEKNYYEVLGVSENASVDEINKAYKKLAVQYHPDKQVGKSDEERFEAENRFKEISEAHDILADDGKRQNYDMQRKMGDMSGFDQFFNPFGGQRMQPKGESVQVVVRVTLKDVINGGNKSVQFNRFEVCQHCHGEGGEVEVCPHCNGTGQVRHTKTNGSQIFTSITACPYCQGRGKKIVSKCKECGGTGFKSYSDTMTVEIPVGVMTGQYNIIPGLGYPCREPNGRPGDLIIIFEVLDEVNYERRGDDVYCVMDIPIKTALCGGKIEVMALNDRSYNITIPKLTEPGKMFRLSGLGVPNMRTKVPGDMYFVVQYKMPASLSEETEKLINDIKEFD